MNNKIKSYGLTAVISFIMIMGYMIAPPMLQPDNYVQTGEQVEQHSDVKLVEQPDDSYMLGLSYAPKDSTPNEAEALVPVVVGAGVVGATAGLSYGFYKGYNAGQYVSESQINDSEADNVIRTDVHDASISSEGSYDSWADELDNDLTTIEGSALQVVNNELINEADNLTSESETVVLAENEVSEYLWGTQTNIVEKHNFHSYDLSKNQMRKLDSANYSNDYYVQNADAVVDINDASQLQSLMKGGSVTYDNGSSSVQVEAKDRVIANVKDDINIPASFSLNLQNEIMIDLNGYTLNQKAPILVGSSSSMKISIVDGKYNLTSPDPEFERGNGEDVLLDIIDVDLEGSDDKVELATIYQASPDFIVNTNNQNFSFIGGGEGGVSITKKDNPSTTVRKYNVTLDPSDVSDANLESDIAFENNKSTANLTAINVSVANTYADTKESPLQVAMPYVSDRNGSYQPIDYQNASLYVDTPTSGVFDQVEPVQFSRIIDIIETRDSRSDAVYSTVSSHARNTWNDTINTIATDDNLSATDFENVTEDLSLFNVDNIDPRDADAILAQYAGIYDSVEQPADTRINLVEQSTDTNYNDVVLFSTDLKTLINQTNNSTILEVNDQFNASDVSRTFVVDPETAEVSELEGSVKITGLTEDGQSVDDVDIQTFDLKSTDLSKQANAIQESVDVTIDTVDNAQESDNGGFVIPPITSGGNGAGTLVILAIIAALLLRRRQNGGRRNNNSIDN